MASQSTQAAAVTPSGVQPRYLLKPLTIHLYSIDEMLQGMVKFPRYGMEDRALFCAFQLVATGTPGQVWSRIRTAMFANLGPHRLETWDAICWLKVLYEKAIIADAGTLHSQAWKYPHICRYIEHAIRLLSRGTMSRVVEHASMALLQPEALQYNLPPGSGQNIMIPISLDVNHALVYLTEAVTGPNSAVFTSCARGYCTGLLQRDEYTAMHYANKMLLLQEAISPSKYGLWHQPLDPNVNTTKLERIPASPHLQQMFAFFNNALKSSPAGTCIMMLYVLCQHNQPTWHTMARTINHLAVFWQRGADRGDIRLILLGLTLAWIYGPDRQEPLLQSAGIRLNDPVSDEFVQQLFDRQPALYEQIAKLYGVHRGIQPWILRPLDDPAQGPATTGQLLHPELNSFDTMLIQMMLIDWQNPPPIWMHDVLADNSAHDRSATVRCRQYFQIKVPDDLFILDCFTQSGRKESVVTVSVAPPLDPSEPIPVNIKRPSTRLLQGGTLAELDSLLQAANLPPDFLSETEKLYSHRSGSVIPAENATLQYSIEESQYVCSPATDLVNPYWPAAQVTYQQLIQTNHNRFLGPHLAAVINMWLKYRVNSTVEVDVKPQALWIDTKDNTGDSSESMRFPLTPSPARLKLQTDIDPHQPGAVAQIHLGVTLGEFLPHVGRHDIPVEQWEYLVGVNTPRAQTRAGSSKKYVYMPQHGPYHGLVLKGPYKNDIRLARLLMRAEVFVLTQCRVSLPVCLCMGPDGTILVAFRSLVTVPSQQWVLETVTEKDSLGGGSYQVVDRDSTGMKQLHKLVEPSPDVAAQHFDEVLRALIVAFLLGVGDMHLNNVLISNDVPYLVDYDENSGRIVSSVEVGSQLFKQYQGKIIDQFMVEQIHKHRQYLQQFLHQLHQLLPRIQTVMDRYPDQRATDITTNWQQIQTTFTREWHKNGKQQQQLDQDYSDLEEEEWYDDEDVEPEWLGSSSDVDG